MTTRKRLQDKLRAKTVAPISVIGERRVSKTEHMYKVLAHWAEFRGETIPEFLSKLKIEGLDEWNEQELRYRLAHHVVPLKKDSGAAT